jgi:hypothetical protein
MAVKTVSAIINGQTHTLVLNSDTGKYEATITAPSETSYTQSGHYYPVTITAEDDAGNTTTITTTDSTFGEKLKLVVKETVAPTINLTSPTSGSTITNNTPEIKFTVLDSHSGVDPDSISVKIDDTTYTSGITKTAITNGYSCSFTPSSYLTDGEHSLTIHASDNDGNEKETSATTFTVDTVPPVLTVTNPTEGLVTNKSTVTVTGTTNDVTSSPVTLTINGETTTVNSDGSFSKVVNLTSGINTITIVSTDSAGKSSTVTRTVRMSTSAPVITYIQIVPNPVDTGKTFTISVTVTDDD